MNPPILSFERILRRLLIALLLFILPEVPILAGAQENKSGKFPPQAQLKEEAEDYFRRWVDEDVVYVISKEERAVFESLTTPEEKEQFIEQFWFQRDPDPRSAANEFKEEHYRRIAYANERFASGFPGWMHDRGRIYIIHGPPDEIEAHPSGGRYDRPLEEGGGTTVAHPFEVWRYRFIEGLGSDVILEFVDPSWSGEYRLALNPDEKDALLHVAGAGNTIAEMIQRDESLEGTAFTSPGNANLRSFRARDTAFDRYQTFTRIRHAKPLKHRDLKRAPERNAMFVLGDLQIRPSLDKVFRPSENLNFYLQVYNVALDQTAMRPSLRVAYRVARDGHPVAQFIDIMGKSIQYLSEQRVVLVLPVSLQSFVPGSYEITVTVKDLIQEREVRVSEAFDVAAEATG